MHVYIIENTGNESGKRIYHPNIDVWIKIVPATLENRLAVYIKAKYVVNLQSSVIQHMCHT